MPSVDASANSNTIRDGTAGRRAVADAREDIARIKATLAEFRDRIDRLESHEDGRT